MGKGGNKNQQSGKQKRRDPTPQPSQQEQQEQYQDEYDEEEFNDDQIDQIIQQNHDQLILQRINQEIQNAQQPLKMTWAAIHSLKLQQMEINKKKDEQIQNVIQRYDKMKTPIFHKIAKAVSGQPLEKQIYTEHQLTKNLSINKNKPQAIPQFWKNSLHRYDFIQGELDQTLLDNCTSLNVDTTATGSDETKQSTIKVVFQFKENPIISNKQLILQVSKKGEQYNVKQRTEIKVKNPKKTQNQASSFIQMFSSEDPADLFSTCEQLQMAYNNCIFFYFNEINQEILQGQGQNEEQQGQEDQQQESEEIKPVKKKQKPIKNVSNNKQEEKKPECKQQ